MTTAPKRRHQFGLRSILVLTGIVSVWLAWNLHAVRERERIAKSASEHSGGIVLFEELTSVSLKPNLPFVWQLLGAKPVARIWVPQEDLSNGYIKRYFPEAEVYRGIPVD